MRYILYFTSLFVNLIIAIIVISNIIDKFLFVTVDMAGSFYFSLISILLLFFFIFHERSTKNLVFLVISISILTISLAVLIEKSIVTSILGDGFLKVSMMLYIASGIIYFYYTSYAYRFLTKSNEDNISILSITLLFSFMYFIFSPAIYFIL